MYKFEGSIFRYIFKGSISPIELGLVLSLIGILCLEVASLFIH